MSHLFVREPALKAELRARKNEKVDLLNIIELLHKHVTASLCETVFRENRTVERERDWTLYALADFWMAVILRAPEALRGALMEAQEGHNGWPLAPATPEAFFERCKSLHWSFFSKLYAEFGSRIVGEAPLAYAASVQDLRQHFPEILLLDGSQMSEVAHRLKILWKVEGAVLPGRIFALYDLFRGITRGMVFDPDARTNEYLLAQQALELIPEGSLCVLDRLYGVPAYFQKLSERDLWGVARRSGSTKVKLLEIVGEWQFGGRESIEDFLVEVGIGSKGVPPQQLRMIRYRKGRFCLELLTNVLDRGKLPAQKILELYRLRWSIERMFFDLKGVLNLNRFYAANPNAVAMQIFAAAIVYNAMRVAQGRIAERHAIPPEVISTGKLFPKLAAASYCMIIWDVCWRDTLRANRGLEIQPPDRSQRAFASTKLGIIVAQTKDRPHTTARRRPRSVWLSFSNIPGGERLLERKLS